MAGYDMSIFYFTASLARRCLVTLRDPLGLKRALHAVSELLVGFTYRMPRWAGEERREFERHTYNMIVKQHQRNSFRPESGGLWKVYYSFGKQGTRIENREDRD